MADVVFVMGASLDPLVQRAVAAERGLDLTSVQSLGRAYLPDVEPCFVAGADGAVLSGRPHRGSATAGALFEVRDDFALFDAIEARHGLGAVRARRRVLTDDGGVHEAEVYALAPTHAPSVAPDAERVASVMRGLQRHGHDVSPIRAAAAGRRPQTEPSSVFVYGTLRRGEQSAVALEKHDPFEGGKGVVHGTVAGRLVDLGSYPGLLPHDDRTVRVTGEVYTFADLDALFADLDVIEGFEGYGAPLDEYVRAIVRVDLDLRERVAWTYVYVGDVTGRALLAGGDWTLRDSGDASLSAARA